MPVPVLPVPLGLTGDTLWDLTGAEGRLRVSAPIAVAIDLPAALTTARTTRSARATTSVGRNVMAASRTRRAHQTVTRTRILAVTTSTVRPVQP